MELSLCFAEVVERMKKELFSPKANLFSLLSASTYETVWMAMVPDPHDPTRLMFLEYLDWILHNQNVVGFWFEDNSHDLQLGHDLGHHEPINHEHQWSRADLMATLTCLIALKTWETNGFFDKFINKGLKFLRDNVGEELMTMRKSREGGDEVGDHMWFLMVELAKTKGLQVFPVEMIKNGLFDDEFQLNETHLEGEGDGAIKERVVMKEIAFVNGSLELCRSPSVTACAFITTGEPAYRTYLQHLHVDCLHGAPPIYLVDKDVIKLWVVDHLERLGCAEHFSAEISNVMDHQYRKWILEDSKFCKKDDAAFQIYKDSLAFRLLRMHGYRVSPRRFCWFINDEDMLSYMKQNYAFFLGPMLSIYKASHIAFLDDHELGKVGEFAQQILQMGILSMKSQTEFEEEIKHELSLKWLARMDHLEHRLYIERGGIYFFGIGKSSPYRILRDEVLLQLATDNFMMRQLVYKKELNELYRWSKVNGLSTMGFGREKTSYCYYALASSICLPLHTDARKEATKCAILITIADDFFDEEGSLSELSILTDAVQRWEGECLTSHSKVIFTAVNNLVHDISLQSFKLHGHDVKIILQKAWKEIFNSWLKEAEWSRSPHYPSIDQYIEIAKTSIAVDMMILASCYLTSSKVAVEECYWDLSNTMITKSLMIACRLLNDLESYEKEAKVGKPNAVLIYLKENPGAKIDDVIAFVRNILERKKKELLWLVMSMDSPESNMPKEWKILHLSYLKVFQMFFNSRNAFDSPTVLLESINKTIYEPLKVKGITRQSNNFISKTKAKVSYGKIMIKKSNYNSSLLSFNLNKWQQQWTDKKLHKPSFACSFMASNIISQKYILWKY